ncbi:ubiquitin-related modifier 1 [Infundibulicybe gibba]|nr:ubiquitin-related modifier 1 [Infundibulicybe gibba]
MSSNTDSTTLTLKVEFGGGLELLFANERKHTITLPSLVAPANDDSAIRERTPPNITYLIHHLRTHLLTERPELFTEGSTVRLGILVLVNDTDWELEGEGECELHDGDEIVFISTLHGG